AVGAGIALIGECLRIWAAGHLHKAREVTVSGPYRWLAHPLYVGSSIMGAGLAVVSGSWLVTGLIGVYFAVTLTAVIRNEEAFLRRAFGDGYDRYRGGASDGGAARRFSVAQAMANREYRAAAGLVIAVVLLALKAAFRSRL